MGCSIGLKCLGHGQTKTVGTMLMQDTTTITATGRLLLVKNLQLQVDDEFVDWGDFKQRNIFYYLDFEGEGNTVNFRIFDGSGGVPNPSWYGDNNGTLTVKIYKVLP
jgi:hypothetical protein